MSKIRHEDKQAPPQPEPETGLTTAEQTFIQGLIDPTTSIEAVVPAEVNPESFWHGLTICCRAMKLMRRMVERLRPVIGRMLVVAQQNPEVYQQKGYRTYEDFLTSKKVHHYTPAFCARAIAELYAVHPKLRMVFCANRKTANEWTRNYFVAIWALVNRPDA